MFIPIHTINPCKCPVTSLWYSLKHPLYSYKQLYTSMLQWYPKKHPYESLLHPNYIPINPCCWLKCPSYTIIPPCFFRQGTSRPLSVAIAGSVAGAGAIRRSPVSGAHFGWRWITMEKEQLYFMRSWTGIDGWFESWRSWSMLMKNSQVLLGFW